MESENTTIINNTLDDGYDFFITDKWKKKYHFKVNSFYVPSGLFSEAIEIIDINPEIEPRIFHLLFDFDQDVEKAEMLLKAKIKIGINRRHLTMKNGKLSINNKQQLRGRIEYSYDSNDSGFFKMFVIDGKRITFEQFAEMLEPYPSFNFKFEIFDSTDMID
ncbi:MAG: hypothetical protein U9R19_15080 [Bacteroidota bacterium]|nr:hypothetical protein [Bacteroidota bacterium]